MSASASCLAALLAQQNLSSLFPGVAVPVQLQQCVQAGAPSWEAPPPAMLGGGALEATKSPVALAGYVGIGLAVLSLSRLLLESSGQLSALLASCWQQEPVSGRFREKLLAAKAEQMRRLVQAGCFLLIPLTAWAPFWGDGPGLSRGVVVVAAQNALALLALWPQQLVSPQSLDAVYALLAALLALAASPFFSGGDPMSLLTIADSFMMALTAVRRTGFRKAPLLLLAKGLFAAASCGLVLENGLHFGQWRPYFAAAQLLVVGLMLLSAPLLERKSRAFMFRLWDLEELQELLSACQCLLRSCFDVVVELDSEGRILSAGPELGALLLRDVSRQRMQGALFQELIEDESLRESFAKRLSAPAAKELGLAESMQLDMRDACGNALHLEAMWFSFRASGSGKRAMLGLRELPDFRREPQPSPGLEAPTVQVSVPDDLMGKEPGFSRMALTLRPDASLPETHSVSSGSFVDAGALLVLDGRRPGYPIREVSPNFRMLVGNVRQGVEIHSVLHKPRRFLAWLVESAQAERTGSPRPRDCRVAFNMPQGKIIAVARCVNPKSASLQQGEVQLLFYNIRAEASLEASAPLANRGTRPASPGGSLASPRTRGSASL